MEKDKFQQFKDALTDKSVIVGIVIILLVLVLVVMVVKF